jgi:hypothetical protein
MAKPDKNKKVDDNEPKNFFSILFRIFGFVKPFFGLFFLAMFLNTIFSILSAISIALIKPIFQILFNSEVSNPSETVSNDFFESITTRFFDFIQWIVDSP